VFKIRLRAFKIGLYDIFITTAKIKEITKHKRGKRGTGWP
jgi:hypothetical protein